MGRIVCPKHGDHSPVAMACFHVRGAVRDAASTPPTIVPVIMREDGEDDWTLYVCAACASAWELSPGDVLVGDEGLDRLTALDWQPVCEACLAAVLNR